MFTKLFICLLVRNLFHKSVCITSHLDNYFAVGPKFDNKKVQSLGFVPSTFGYQVRLFYR